MRCRPGILALLVVPTAAVLPAGSAVAGKKPPNAVRDLGVSPKAPKANQTVSVSFRAPALARDRRLDVSLAAPGGSACSHGYAVRVASAKPRGRRVRIRFRPGAGGRSVFCAGTANVVIGHAGADGKVVVLARKRFEIAPAGGPETYGVPGKITLLDGSSITVRAPGRPDRTIALTGIVRGFVPGKFTPGSDIALGTLTGGLWMRMLQVDSLCSGAGVATDFPVVAAAASQLLLEASGDATLTLALKADAASLAGCASGGAGPTALTLTGKVTPDGLLKLPLTGSISGVAIAPGVTATVTLNLLVNVDFSGKTS